MYVHVSATLHIIALMILFFKSLFTFLLNNSFLWLKAFLAIPILVLIYVSHLPSLVMRAPRYLSRSTCSSFSPSIVMLITSSPFLDIFIIGGDLAPIWWGRKKSLADQIFQ